MIRGFTNGVFDLLHEGHRYFLRECSKHCDELIVGVNTDASVRALKGYGRPVQTLATRMAAIKALGYSTLAFDEDDPTDIMKILQPQFIFKGDEYNPKDVVGAGFGTLVLIPMLPGYSTTSEIAKRRA